MYRLRRLRKRLPDRSYRSRLTVSVKKIGRGITLAFFLTFFSPPFSAALDGAEQAVHTGGFPVIHRLDARDAGFRQFIADVQSNRRRLFNNQRSPQEAAEHLTIYQYTVRSGEDLFFLAARSNIPFSALASLNRLSSPAMLKEGTSILLPSAPGIFVPAVINSELEMLISGARYTQQNAVQITIRAAGEPQIFYFFPGADFTHTERAFFLHSNFFRFPLRTYRLTSGFGMRRSPICGSHLHHNGIDLAAPMGTNVYAVADGIVYRVGYHRVYGVYVIINHANRWTSKYAHLQRAETSQNSRVSAGTLIGRVGTTGLSTGPHLHFELWQGGGAVDPLRWLR